MALDPNRYASAKEALLLRAQIADEQEDNAVLSRRTTHARTVLHDVMSALQEAQACADLALQRLAKLEDAKRGSDDHLQQLRGLLHPVRKVPEELLADMFLAGAHLYDDIYVPQQVQHHPFDVAAVCRRWRRVAIATPRLWTHVILLKLIADPTGDAYLETMLARSSRLDLKVFLMCQPTEFQYHDRGPYAEMLFRVNNLSMAAQSLSEEITSTTTRWDEWSLFGCSVPRLRYLEIDGDRHLIPVRHIIQGTFALNVLKLENADLLFPQHMTLCSLESITMENCVCSISSFRNFSRAASNLQTFEMHGTEIPGGSSSIPVIFPRVMRVTITGCSDVFVSNVRFLAAEVVTLLDTEDVEEIPDIAQMVPETAPLRQFTAEIGDRATDLPLRWATLESLTLDDSNAAGWIPFIRRLVAPRGDGTWEAPRLNTLLFQSYYDHEAATPRIQEALVAVCAGRASAAATSTSVVAPRIEWRVRGNIDAVVEAANSKIASH